MPVLGVTLVLVMLWVFRDFSIIYVLTGGGPLKATQTLSIMTYEQAFGFFKMGYASAVGVVTLVICVIASRLMIGRRAGHHVRRALSMRSRTRDRILLYATVVLTCALLVFPIYWLFITALSPPDQLRSFPPKLWPDQPQLGGLRPRSCAERPDPAFWLGNSALAAIGAVAHLDGGLGARRLQPVALQRARRPVARPVHPDREDAAGDAARHPAVRHLPHARPDRQPVVDHPRPRDPHHPVHDLDAEGLFRHHPARARAGGDGRWLLAARRPGPGDPAGLARRASRRRRSTASCCPGPTTPMRGPSSPTPRPTGPPISASPR